MVAYVRHQLSSPRQSQMKIDSLLNPPSDDGRDEYGTTVSSYNQRTIVSPSSHSGSYSHSPVYSPSLNHYWYRQYQRTSPGTATTEGTSTVTRIIESMPITTKAGGKVSIQEADTAIITTCSCRIDPRKRPHGRHQIRATHASSSTSPPLAPATTPTGHDRRGPSTMKK